MARQKRQDEKSQSIVVARIRNDNASQGPFHSSASILTLFEHSGFALSSRVGRHRSIARVASHWYHCFRGLVLMWGNLNPLNLPLYLSTDIQRLGACTPHRTHNARASRTLFKRPRNKSLLLAQVCCKHSANKKNSFTFRSYSLPDQVLRTRIIALSPSSRNHSALPWLLDTPTYSVSSQRIQLFSQHDLIKRYKHQYEVQKCQSMIGPPTSAAMKDDHIIKYRLRSLELEELLESKSYPTMPLSRRRESIDRYQQLHFAADIFTVICVFRNCDIFLTSKLKTNESNIFKNIDIRIICTTSLSRR